MTPMFRYRHAEKLRARVRWNHDEWASWTGSAWGGPERSPIIEGWRPLGPVLDQFSDIIQWEFHAGEMP